MILAAHVADQAVVTGLDTDIAAHRAGRADRRSAAHVPGPGRKPPVGGRQRTDRADLPDVALEVRIQGTAAEGSDHGVDASIEQDQLAVLGYLVKEAHASLALDTAFHVEQDPVGQRNRLGVLQLVLDETAEPRAVVDGVVLQVALAPLVADGTVQRLSLIHISEPTRLGMISY